MKLYTVGYEAMDIDEFCESLQKYKIQMIADLRKNPVSRKRGFSKRLMAENLQKHHIEYMHFGGLGVPTEWRKQAKEEIITRKKMFRDYVRKILPKAQDDIEQIKKLMKQKKLALLCYEADASDCHRSFVAKEIVDQELRLGRKKVQVVDLDILPKTPGLFKKPKRAAALKS